MGKFIPKPLKYPLIATYILVRTLARGRMSGQIKLNLAGVLPPLGSSKIVHGGKPKLLHLRRRFGDTWRGFNLAYFASSGLPFAPALWLNIYRLCGVKTVWNQNGVAYPALYPDEVVNKINSLLSPIHLSDYVVYQTEFTKRCSDLFLGAFKGPSSILINPVDTTLFTPRTMPLSTASPIIMMLGNHFESRDRMAISLEAVRQVKEIYPETKLIVIGKCDQEFSEPWIEKKGSFFQEEAPALFQSAQIFLHLKYLDPCPTAVEEALACGLPVIGQRNGGMPELVDERSGILLSVAEDFNELHYPEPQLVAEAIIKAYKDLQSFSAGARARALRFDSKIWLAKHESIFNELIRK
jgi:glycosyltransferase involved in cell wall biosynthesis